MKNILNIFICLCICGCTKYNHKSTNESLSIKSSEKTVGIKELFYDFKLLYLKTDEESAFQNINKIVYHNIYYILVKSGRRQVLVFDKDGNYLHSIGRTGKGKGEYTNIEDFTIDEKNNKIIILAFPSTAFVYDMQGEFLLSKKLDNNTLLWNIISNDNGYICTTNHMTYTEGEHAYLMYFFDKDFNLLAKRQNVLPKQMPIPSTVTKPIMKLCDNNYVYMDIFSSNVYNIDLTDSISITTKHIGLNNPVPLEVFEDVNTFMSNQTLYDYIISAITVNNKLLVFYKDENDVRVFITDMHKDETISYEYRNWFPELMYGKDSVIYSKINPRMVAINHEIFDSLSLEQAKNYANEIILTFKCKFQ